MTEVDDFAALWRRLDPLLEARVPEVFAALSPPADGSATAWLREVAASAGVLLHPAVAATYAAHDGARQERRSLVALLRFDDDVAWANACCWHSLEVSRRELDVWRRVFGADEDEGWPARWLPMASDGGGNAVVLDVETSALLALDHEDGSARSGPMLGAFLSELERELEAGLVVQDEAGEPTRETAG